MITNFIDLEKQNNIGIMTMNNGPKNYIPAPDFISHDKLIEWLRAHNIKGLIITGSGKHFSAGADLTELKNMAQSPDVLLSRIKKGMALLNTIENLEIPVIAAINGACFGGGLEIALSTHIRICSSRSLFAFPEADLGFMPGLGGTLRLTRLCGTAVTAEMVLSSEIINAEKALELNIVDYMVNTKEIMDNALSLMKKMVEKRPLDIINAVMRAMHNSRTLSFQKALDEESKMFCKLAVNEMIKKELL